MEVYGNDRKLERCMFSEDTSNQIYVILNVFLFKILKNLFLLPLMYFNIFKKVKKIIKYILTINSQVIYKNFVVKVIQIFLFCC